MLTIYLDKWDNYPPTDPTRRIALNQVIETVEEFGEVGVSFDYMGRARHVQASEAMIEKLKAMGKEYDYEVGYEHYKFIIRKKEGEDVHEERV